ncbi:MAG: putative RND superfamily exporter protein [Bradymonadia bacterium]
MTRSPWWVLLGVLLVTAAAASGIPRLTADFTPSDLFAKFDDQAEVSASFGATFGNTDNVLLFLIEADDVFEPEVLQFSHDHTLWFREQGFAGSVAALTTLPLPHRASTDGDRTILDSVYQVGALHAERVRNALQNPGQELPAAELPEVHGMFRRLVAGEATVAPAISGEIVTAEEAFALRETIAGSPLVEGRLVSEDHTLLAVAVTLAPGYTRNDAIARVVDTVHAHLDEVESPSGVNVMMTGLPYVRNDVVQKMRADQSVMLPLSLLMCLLILFASFRWWPAMALPTGAVVVSAVLLVGGMGWVAEPFNILNNIVPLLIIIIGISNSIHVINRYGEELRAGHSGIEAAAGSVRAMTVACFLTSFTTAVGFASLMVSQTDTLQRFGVTAAVGVLISYVVTITFLPAALSRVRAPAAGSAAATEGVLEDLVEAVTRRVIARPIPVLVISALSFLGAVGLGSQVSIDAALLDQFGEDDPIYQTTRLVERQLGGVRPLEVYVRADTEGAAATPDVLNALDDIAAWAMQQEGALSSMSAGTFLHEVNAMQRGPDARDEPFTDANAVARGIALLNASERQPLSRWLSADHSEARLSIGVRDMGAQRTISLANDLEVEARERLEPLGVRVAMTGDAYVASKGLDAVISDLVGSLGLAVVIIFFFMAVLFRSLRYALLSIPPNILPLAGTLAFMSILGVDLNAATAIIFSISIGMAVDGAIHVLARFREEQQRCATTDEALIRSARGTGKAILMTSVSLILGFGVMFTSSFVPVRLFGALIGVTVFGTLVATAVVLPALLKVAVPERKA